MFKISFAEFLLIVSLAQFLLHHPTRAQTTLVGGKGMLRLYDAEPVAPGWLYVNSFFSYFAEKRQNDNVLSKDITLQLSSTLGFSSIFEGFLYMVPYQTDQQHLWGALGETRVGIKAHMPRPGKPMQMGIVSFTKFPTGRTYPVPYEPFSEKSFGYGIVGALLYNLSQKEAKLPLKIIANVGYLRHRANQPFFMGDHDQLCGGLGFKWLTRSVLLYTEVSGELFFHRPDIRFRQNSLRFSQGCKFTALNGLIFDAAVDVELGRYRPSSSELMMIPRYYENYADWKLNLGVTFQALIFEKWQKRTRQEIERSLRQGENLNQIREKREKVIDELMEFKKRLEDEKKEEIPF
ncbi:MAG: hypothetical protein EHM72_01845 [Calditrichaeota bacterium]|nr:MAG: hypothetical protein EHM72_01845 [Calditrichota bacterium]